MKDLRTQCLLERHGVKQTAWIEARGAKVGCIIELKSENNERWTVREVYDTVDASELILHQNAARTHRKATDI